jgi:GNAT superfamily N-acetyltransferase
MTIRRATPYDVPTIVEMAEQFVRETPYASLIVLSAPHVAGLAERLIVDPEGALFVAEDRGGAVVGMMALKAFDHPMSNLKTVTELVWWVDPHYRGSVGVRLLHAAETWAKDVGARILQMVAPNERVGQFYERVGYTAVEQTFQKRIAE